MTEHKAKIKAICWVENGKKIYDMWQGKEIDDKDCININDTLTYRTDVKGNSLDYKDNLIKKIIQLNLNNKGLTHFEVWESGILKNIFRITNLKTKNQFNSWDEVISFIQK